MRRERVLETAASAVLAAALLLLTENAMQAEAQLREDFHYDLYSYRMTCIKLIDKSVGCKNRYISQQTIQISTQAMHAVRPYLALNLLCSIAFLSLMHVKNARVYSLICH